MKIRVLEVLPTLKRAGAEHVAVALACGLDRGRFETSLVTLYDPFPGGLEPVLEEQGIAVRPLGKRRGFDPRMFPRLASTLREFSPHVVHTHSYLLRYVLPAAVAARAAAFVHTVHNLAGRDVERFGRVVNRLAFRRGVKAVAAGGEVARSFRAVYGLDPAATIPNGIDTDRYYRPGARDGWRRAHGFAPEDVLIASVARLDPQKDPLGLIAAFAGALAGEPRCHLVIAGDGALRQAAEELMARLSLAGRVHLIGVRGDIPEILSACDLFALASRWEGMPVALMEAAAAGLPAVATSVDGAPEVVEHERTGLLVPPGDLRALGDRLAELVRDERRRRELGECAKVRSARFHVSRMIDSYAALFERLAGAPR